MIPAFDYPRACREIPLGITVAPAMARPPPRVRGSGWRTVYAVAPPGRLLEATPTFTKVNPISEKIKRHQWAA